MPQYQCVRLRIGGVEAKDRTVLCHGFLFELEELGERKQFRVADVPIMKPAL